MPSPSSNAKFACIFSLYNHGYQCSRNFHKLDSRMQTKRSIDTHFYSALAYQCRIYCSTHAALAVILLLFEEYVFLLHLFKRWFARVLYRFSSSAHFRMAFNDYLGSRIDGKMTKVLFHPILLSGIYWPSMLLHTAVFSVLTI